jgi:hypothetical protein
MRRGMATQASAARTGSRAGVVLFGLLLACMWVGTARADLPKRNVPDYDGRQDTTSVGDVALWVPRVVLSPLYLVSEYVVRQPLGLLISSAERANVPEALYEFFIFGENKSAGVLPIAFLDFGFYPSVGLYFFWNDAFVKGYDVRVKASTWGSGWLAGSVTNILHLDAKTHLELQGSGIRRPDYAFFGLGPNALERDLGRYGSAHLDAHAALDVMLATTSHITTTLGVRRVHFHSGGYDGDPLLEQQVARGRFLEPYGYRDGYSLLYNNFVLALDSRHPAPAPGSGVRFEVGLEQMTDLTSHLAASYVRYHASLGGFWDLNDHHRVVSVSVMMAGTDPLGHYSVPFTELATIGGSENMRGFAPGRLWGRSATVGTLRYRWPIWVWLDGSIQFAVGNVFGKHFEDFSPKLLRFSSAIGIESVGAVDSSVEMLVGLGTETFDHGTQVTSARIVVGVNRGF